MTRFGTLWRQVGFTLLELLVILPLLGVLLGLAVTQWRGHTATQRLRYAVPQVAADLRQAMERAKEGRVTYTVTFVGGESTYVVSGGGFTERARLPAGVTIATSEVVTFSPFGRPDAARTIRVQNSAGSGTVTITAAGGITYTAP